MPTPLTTPLVTPPSEKHTLAANVAKLIGGGNEPITVHIPTGTSATVYTTCCLSSEINADTADWVEWPNGVKAGPFMDALLHRVTAIKVLSVAGGVIYFKRN
jgi:hypothetical protein